MLDKIIALIILGAVHSAQVVFSRRILVENVPDSYSG